MLADFPPIALTSDPAETSAAAQGQVVAPLDSVFADAELGR